jgi:hypothetical protein
MIRHRLDTELCPSGWWGWCSCRNWSAGPCQEEHDVDSAHRMHVGIAAFEEAEDDDLIDWLDGAYDTDAITREEWLHARE